MFSSGSKASPVGSRFVLMAGFGGLLLLMAFAEFDGIAALRQIQKSTDTMREDFILRTRLLERIRGDVYVSGTYVRDYLLETEAGRAEGHLYSLLETRRDMDQALSEYKRLLTPREAGPFQVLTRELAGYWGILEPVFRWTPEERRQHGFIFLRDEVSPRRMAMIGIADQIRSINESQTSAGRAEIEQTFAQYRRRLTITIGLTIGLGLLLAAFTMRKILGLESETAMHFREISRTQAELKQLSARLVEAQEDERRSISRELHDEVGQALTGVLVEMANLSTLIRTAAADAVAAKAAEIKRLVENCISAVRNMALLLRPSMLDDLGLAPALRWQVREVSKRSGVSVKLSADEVPEQLPEEHKTCIYRVVQEALHNAVQHSGAKNVWVSVHPENAALILTIQDDGKGFDPRTDKGMGLLGMEERVTNLGGTFAADSHPGSGATIRISLPIPAYAGVPDPAARPQEVS
jgi:signal transduction histidine kinase